MSCSLSCASVFSSFHSCYSHAAMFPYFSLLSPSSYCAFIQSRSHPTVFAHCPFLVLPVERSNTILSLGTFQSRCPNQFIGISICCFLGWPMRRHTVCSLSALKCDCYSCRSLLVSSLLTSNRAYPLPGNSNLVPLPLHADYRIVRKQINNPSALSVSTL